MISLIRQLYFSVIKPRSLYLSDIDSPSRFDKRRVVDAENGKHKGVSYRLETVVCERETSLYIPNLNRPSVEDIVKKQGVDVNAAMSAIRPRQEDVMGQWLDRISNGGVINHIFTRPSYGKFQNTYLILTGLSQDDLEQVRLNEVLTSKNSSVLDGLNYPKYTGTPLEVFLFGLSEARFRKTAGDTGADNLYGSSYRVVDRRAVPVLTVRDIEHGHEAAQNCIDFALEDGRAILQDEICLLRHATFLRKRLKFESLDRSIPPQ